jgi:hypothetical protein
VAVAVAGASVSVRKNFMQIACPRPRPSRALFSFSPLFSLDIVNTPLCALLLLLLLFVVE